MTAFELQMRRSALASPEQIDLQRVAAPDRARFWQAWVPAAFPGLKVLRISGPAPIGVARRASLGSASLWSMIVANQKLRHAGEQRQPTVGVLFCHEGRAHISQDGRSCLICTGDMWIIDNSRPFEVENLGVGSVTSLQIPRPMAVSRFPDLLRLSAQCLPSTIPEVALLHALIRNAAQHAAALSEESGAALLEALLLLLAALPVPTCGSSGELHWRVRTALADIERLLDRSTLCSAELARRQKVSRRRLDALMVEHLGTTLASQIHERRLAEAATRLSSLRQRRQSITSIAFASGFASNAHFARCFRRRFGMTPSDWREIHLKG
jgi:AraC-like DNA-binding protein